GTLIVPGVLAFFGGPIFGWAKPVPVNRHRLNNPRYGMMAVAAAGPASNLIMAGAGAVGIGLLARGLTAPPEGMLAFALMALRYFLMITIFLALCNLLPIPPFDGSHIVEGLLPRTMAEQYARLQQVGMFLLIALIAVTWAFPGSGIIENVVLPPVEWLQEKYLALAFKIAGG